MQTNFRAKNQRKKKHRKTANFQQLQIQKFWFLITIVLWRIKTWELYRLRRGTKHWKSLGDILSYL